MKNSRAKPIKVRLLGVIDKWAFDPVPTENFPIETTTCQMIPGIGDADQCVVLKGKIYHINWFKYEKL